MPTVSQVLTNRLKNLQPSETRTINAIWDPVEHGPTWTWIRTLPDGAWCQTRVPANLKDAIFGNNNSKILSVQINNRTNLVTSVVYDPAQEQG